MERVLPFELYKYHKTLTRCRWKKLGLVFENESEFDAIYSRLIYARKCELCHKTFTKSRDRQMEHQHLDGKFGPFRNIVCHQCNQRKSDVKIQSNNTSGYTGICWHKCSNRWVFEAHIKGKKKHIKCMADLDELIDYATKWKIDNNYNT